MVASVALRRANFAENLLRNLNSFCAGQFFNGQWALNARSVQGGSTDITRNDGDVMALLSYSDLLKLEYETSYWLATLADLGSGTIGLRTCNYRGNPNYESAQTRAVRPVVELRNGIKTNSSSGSDASVWELM